MRLAAPPDGRPWALLALAGVSVVANILLAAKMLGSPSAPEVLEPEAVASVADAAAGLRNSGAVGGASPGVGEAPGAAEDGPGRRDVHLVRTTVAHSLARTFQQAVPEHADVVSAVYARLFVWDLDLRKDIQKGDEISLAYTWDGELAEIPAASYRSGKRGATFKAFRFHATGDTYPSWWNEDGSEVPRRLVDGPLRDYEQVTSLLKDRPKHKGMDFKLPEGGDVIAPKAATVTRVNWNTAFNGGCVEARYDDGTLARFLHLSETIAKPGQRLAPGTVLGKSGNTGRSTAPHLHYELEKGGKVVDPVAYHGVTRRTLPASDLDAFRATISRYEATLAGT